MDTTVNAAREEIKDLRSENVLVLWGGTNVISKNNIKVGIKYMCVILLKKMKR